MRRDFSYRTVDERGERGDAQDTQDQQSPQNVQATGSQPQSENLKVPGSQTPKMPPHLPPTPRSVSEMEANRSSIMSPCQEKNLPHFSREKFSEEPTIPSRQQFQHMINGTKRKSGTTFGRFSIASTNSKLGLGGEAFSMNNLLKKQELSDQSDKRIIRSVSQDSVNTTETE